MMKFLAIFFFLSICTIQYRIWWGEGSHREIEQLQAKITEQKEQNDLLEKENQILKKEIQALKTNPKVLEEKARENLGLVKRGETFYRIIPKD